jgi:acyl-CoA synthetase (AMP-forming)/AMP-acid ligase II
VGELFLKQLMMHGERVALVDGVTSDEYTYLQIRSRAIRLARTMQAAGVGKHDVVSIVSENRIELPVTLIAAFLCGATVAPINLTYSDREYTQSTTLDVVFGLSFRKAVCMTIENCFSFTFLLVLHRKVKKFVVIEFGSNYIQGDSCSPFAIVFFILAQLIKT